MIKNYFEQEVDSDAQANQNNVLGGLVKLGRWKKTEPINSQLPWWTGQVWFQKPTMKIGVQIWQVLVPTNTWKKVTRIRKKACLRDVGMPYWATTSHVI